MKIKNLVLNSLVNALGIMLYVSLVVALMNHASRLSAKMPGFLGPVAFLLLFVLSAAVTGTLFLGEPVLFYFNDQKKEAIKLFLYTLGWLILILVLVFGAILFFY